MRRIAFFFATLIPCIGGFAQPSFSSKAEAMDFAKTTHNAAIIRIQQYTTTSSIEDISAAFILSSSASVAARSCITQNSDVLSYGSDAVRIVKINNYVAAYLFHQQFHHVLDSDHLSISVNEVTEQFRQNAIWMSEMLKIDLTVISWLWGTITEQDIYGIVAFLQLLDNHPDWEKNDRIAGDKSILRMVDRPHFDLNLFTENGKWLLF